jgi:D-beta-D-heptose 7-phosphate kinase/D-beta-D-heptose 1-phosphate adenosyltransferase
MSGFESPADLLQQAYATALEDDGGYIMLVGDLMVDMWFKGYVDRMSPEDPSVPVLVQEEGDATLGGAGLVYQHLISMGLPRVRFVSVCGSDFDYVLQDLTSLLRGPNIHLVEDASRPTTLKSRIIVKPRQQVVRVDRESKKPISGRVQAEVMARLREAIGEECRLVVVSDYGKGTITEAVMAHIRRICAEREVPFIVDPAKRGDWELYRGAQVVTPNEHEINRGGPGIKNVWAGGFPWVCETRGKAGMKLGHFEPDEDWVEYPATDDECVDAIGAGDVVVAALAVFMSGGAPMELAVQMANAIAGWYVARLGPVSPTARVVEKLISQRAPFFTIGEKAETYGLTESFDTTS